MKKTIATLLITCFIIPSMHAADNEIKIETERFEVTSHAQIPGLLGEDLSSTAIGFDIDGTLLSNYISLPPSIKLFHLKRSEIGLNNEECNIWSITKHLVRIDDDEELFTSALEKGKWVDYPNSLRDENTPALTPHDVKNKLKQEKKYEYTEEKDGLKEAVKAIQMKKAFVGIVTAGATEGKRKELIRELGFHDDNWKAGSRKLDNLFEMMLENIETRKADKSSGNPNFGDFRDYETLVLVDDHLPTIIEFLDYKKFITRIKNSQNNKEINLALFRKVKKIIGIHYNNSDLESSTQKLVKEYNTIAGTNFPTEEAPKSLGYGLQYLGY